jgi:hypothetical protein
MMAVSAMDVGDWLRHLGLEALLARAAPPDEDVALIADLRSLSASGRHPLPNLSAQRKKERTLVALIGQLEGLARKQPVIMVFEDAHWVDPTSRKLLDLTVERVPALRVLLIATFRPEFQPPWTGQQQVTMLALNRLDRRDRTALVAQIAGGKALPDEVVDQIVDRTDGVPLFIEELTKSVLESGVPLVGIPTTLHDSLMARLDRLASVRQGRTSAAIGASFPTYYCVPSLIFLRMSCARLSPAWSPPNWCSREACRPTGSTASSTRWCRTRRMPAYCAALASNCTRRSLQHSKPIRPR